VCQFLFQLTEFEQRRTLAILAASGHRISRFVTGPDRADEEYYGGSGSFSSEKKASRKASDAVRDASSTMGESINLS
jgi:hypothetical protein